MARKTGFTLIELSIVLVIIGLIVGGVLVGRDLINAATIRAQISQIEKYQTAVNTFKGKYNGYLPGDIPDPDASKFGFIARAGAGQGDGNGILESWNGAFICPDCTNGGEYLVFWKDLFTARMIPDSLTTIGFGYTVQYTTLTMVPLYLPAASIGRGNYIYVYESYPSCCPATGTGNNFFGLSAIVAASGGGIISNPGLIVSQAYAIDQKVDDGLPQTGRVFAGYVNGQSNAPKWAAGGGAFGASNTAATAASSTTCYDNNNISGAIQQYSITQNNGSGVNCALSFQIK